MIKLNKYVDCFGVLHANKFVNELSPFITKINDIYYSRNNAYYESKTLSQVSKLRNELLSLISDDKFSNYVIFDYVINFSAQVYYNLMLNNAKNTLIQQAKSCLEEDVCNMVTLIENKHHFCFKQNLPTGENLVEFRSIELDNKLEIYSFIKAFGKTNHTFVNPGLGSILIGPFFKAIWGSDYKNILYSRFKKLDNLNSKIDKDLSGNLYLLDDNIGSGFTTQELMHLLKDKNLVGVSSVEYDWFLYDIISQGKSPYTKFNYSLYSQLTLLNTRNHRFLDNLEKLITTNPNNYLSELKLNNFAKKNKSDLEQLFKVGKSVAKKYLPKEKYKQALNFTKHIIKTNKEI